MKQIRDGKDGHSLERVARMFRAVGDRTRLGIMCALVGRPASVGELAEHLRMEVANLSYHLKILREAGVVRVRAVGQRRVYALAGRTRLGVLYLRPEDGCEVRLPLAGRPDA